MTNEQIEQYRQIIANAPERATHVDENGIYHTHRKNLTWFKYSIPNGGFTVIHADNLDDLRSLDDLRDKIAQHDELERLREKVKRLEDSICVAEGLLPDASYNFYLQRVEELSK